MAKKKATRPGKAQDERQLFIDSLRRNGRLIEAESEHAPLPPGVTHVLVKGPGTAGPRLVEKRKSLF